MPQESESVNLNSLWFILFPMKTLDHRSYQQALAFLSESARPLELERWRFLISAGSAAEVTQELARFKNDDGGYGRALEPDMRSLGSTVLAATEALEILYEIGQSPDSPDVLAVLRWLTDPQKGYDKRKKLWPYLPNDIDEAPHAPWWNNDTLEETFEGFLINPRAKILGHIFRSYGELGGELSAGVFRDHINAVLELVENLPDKTSPDTLRSLLFLYEQLPDGELQKRLESRLPAMITASVVTDPSSWGEYGLQPLEVAETPQSPWFLLLEDAASAHLDYLVDTQLDDGSWKPFWTWGEAYPDAWETAVKEWKGVLIVKNMKRLKSHGRIPLLGN